MTSVVSHEQVSISEQGMDNSSKSDEESVEISDKEEASQKPQALSEETLDSKKQSGSSKSAEVSESSSDDDSFNTLLDKKNSLTNEVRDAGISEKDEAFMDSFSEEMTKNKKEQAHTSATKNEAELSKK